MNPGRLRAGVVVGLMLLAFVGAKYWRPTVRLADSRPRIELASLFPASFGDWRVDDHVPVQLVSPDTQAMIDKIYNQTLSRTYVNRRGDRVMLSIAYGGDQSDATRAHRPEVCYPAQGFQVLSSQIAGIDVARGTLKVKQLVAQQGPRNEPITYWISVGELTTVTGTEQKLAQLSYTTRGVIPDGMLVRVSSIDTQPTRAFTLQQAFVQQMLAAMPPAQRVLVAGRDSV